MESGGGSIRTAIRFGVDSKGRRRDSGGSAVDLIALPAPYKADLFRVVRRTGRTAIMKLLVRDDDTLLAVSHRVGTRFVTPSSPRWACRYKKQKI